MISFLPRRLALVSVFAFLIATRAAFAGVVAYDPFLSGSNGAAGEYTPSSLTGQNPAVTGFLAAWYSYLGDASAVTNALAYSNASGDIVSSGGSARANSDCWMRRYLGTPITHASTGTVYVSFMLQLQSTDASAYRAFRLSQDTSSAAEVGLNSATFGNSHFNLRLLESNALLLDLGAPDEAVNLFVLKFNLSSQTNSDSVTVWRNPSNLGSEAGSAAAGTLNGFNMTFNTATLWMFGGSGPQLFVDELRLGTTWADVVAVRRLQLSAPRLLGNGQFQMTVSGANSPIVIEASTNFTSWTPIFTNPAPSDPYVFTDTAAPGLSRRFYRAYKSQ
jgi:hypothetical protein